jgi:hypothetical protein
VGNQVYDAPQGHLVDKKGWRVVLETFDSMRAILCLVRLKLNSVVISDRQMVWIVVEINAFLTRYRRFYSKLAICQSHAGIKLIYQHTLLSNISLPVQAIAQRTDRTNEAGSFRKEIRQ